MRLAFFSPFSPQPSGISCYSEDLLPHLAKYVELDLFYDGELPTNLQVLERFAIYPIKDFGAVRRTRGYDACLYQMGNSIFHTAIYATLREHPGITVLHEHFLHNFFLTTTGGEGDWASYWRELAYNVEPALLTSLSPGLPAFSPKLPLARRVIDLSMGVIVHTHEMARRVLADAPQAQVAVVPMGMPLPPQPYANRAPTLRQKLNLPPDAYIVGVFGQLSTHKRLHVVLQAFARLRRDWPQAICLLVGRNIGEYNLPDLSAKVGLEPPCVVETGFVPSEALPDYIHAADVWVNLRYPIYGETSAAALRLMAFGKPIIVSDVGTFADYPDDTCVKVAVNAAETEYLYHGLSLLAQRPDLRAQLGDNARRYVQQHHSLDEVGNQMAKAVREILAGVETGNWRGLHG